MPPPRIQGLDREFSFRYLNRILYYGVLCSTLLIGFFSLWRFSKYLLELIGFTKGFYSLTNVLFYLFSLLVLSGVIAAVSFFLAYKIADRQGTAYFYRNHAELYMGAGMQEVPYKDVENLYYHTMLYQKLEWMPQLYRFKIKTARKKIVIHCSLREAWACQKKQNERPSVHQLSVQFCVRAEQPVKFIEHV